MKQINWGIIGCGDVAEIKSGPAFNLIENSKLIAVMRRNKEKAESFAKRHNVPLWFDDAGKIINNPEINAVYIATPPNSHAEYSIKSLNAGKITYVEKPMALNYEECREMIKAGKKNKVPLYVAYYRRSLDYFNKIKQLIDDGIIGKVRFINVNNFYPPHEEDYDKNNLPWRVMPDISGGGYFVDIASHQIDILDYFFGPIKKVKSIVKNQANLYEAEDIVCINYEFESNIIGCGLWCFSSSVKRIDETIIMGEKGFIKFSFFSFVPIKMENEDGSFEFDIKPPENIQYQLIKSIIDELNGISKCPSTCYTAARTTKIIDEILREYRQKK
ncbi:MAG: Gfo/Idh/MocA family oxidoreductase [Spirochaetes bacterium]|nr:Gfo/Idh/MocA family oxidoreductase [Spirochaetota bacterium]